MDCPKCHKPMVLRKHRKLTDKDLKKPYIFSQWFYCPHCHYIKHFEDNKIFNVTTVFRQHKIMRMWKLLEKEKTPEEKHLESISKEK